jgi:acyl-CoA thioester hydrolase
MTKKPLPQPGNACTCEFRARYAECDAQGYLHHAKYWEYFEHARTELLRKGGFRYRDLEASGIMFVVYKAAVKYIKPIRYDDLVNVTVTVARLTRTRVDHTYVITCGDQKTCEATTTLACVARDGKPRLMPEDLWAHASP